MTGTTDGHSAKCSFVVRAASFHPVGELWDAERLVPTETELSNFFGGISLATLSCAILPLNVLMLQ